MDIKIFELTEIEAINYEYFINISNKNNNLVKCKL